MKMKLRLYGATVFLSTILMCGFTCSSSSTQKLATASDAVAHALADAQTASKQAVIAGVATPAEDAAFEAQLSRVSTAGVALDSAIRNNQSAASVSTQLNNFLTAFNSLNQSGTIGFKDKNTQLAISTAITTAEASIAVIAAAVGTGGK